MLAAGTVSQIEPQPDRHLTGASSSLHPGETGKESVHFEHLTHRKTNDKK